MTTKLLETLTLAGEAIEEGLRTFNIPTTAKIAEALAAIREQKAGLEKQDSEHVAWLRYKSDPTGNKSPRIKLCDSDDPGAFKVFRHANPAQPVSEPVALNEDEGKAMSEKFAEMKTFLHEPENWDAGDHNKYFSFFCWGWDYAKERYAAPQPVSKEPVATDSAKKDAVFEASIQFIKTLTGMEPPPIEVAPPEVFAPFREFTEKVCKVFSAPSKAEQEQPVSEPVVRFCPGCGLVGEVDAKYKDCCPDGAKARKIPKDLAEHCSGLFDLAIGSAAPHPQSVQIRNGA